MDDLLDVAELDGREIYPAQDDSRRGVGRTTTTPGESREAGPGPAPILVILLIVIWLWVPFIASVVFLIVILAIFATVDNPADLQSLQGATFSGITTASESLGLRNLQAILGKTAALLGTSNAVKFWNQLLESTPALQGLARDGLAVAVSQVDWVETGDAHVFKADMPGIRKEDVKVELEGDSILQISGQRNNKEGADDAIVEFGETWHRVERSQGRFYRRFQLPQNAKVDEVQAKVENGVLTVTVPKIKRKTGLPRAVAIQ